MSLATRYNMNLSYQNLQQFKFIIPQVATRYISISFKKTFKRMKYYHLLHATIMNFSYHNSLHL